MKRYLLAVALLFPFAAIGAEPTDPDPFAISRCVVTRVPPVGEDARYLTKVFRPAYALEIPFHAVIDETRQPLDDHNADHPEATVEMLLLGHGGYLLETGTPQEMESTDFLLFLTPWFAREAESPPHCWIVRPIDEVRSYIRWDPYTGNAFASTLNDTIVDLVVIDTEGIPVARVRFDMFSAAPLTDRTGNAYEDLAGEDGLFWFDLGRLAPFVSKYHRVGGEEYARFVGDAFLALWVDSWTGEELGTEDVRLPYLPSVAGPPDEREAETGRLEGLRTVSYEYFSPKKPRKGGVFGGLLPLLKLLEARDCFSQSDEPPAVGSCPAYSVMAAHTEFLREFHQDSEDDVYAYVDVWDLLRRRGVCPEHLYPLPDGQRVGWPGTMDEFSKRAEKALNRALKRGESDDLALAAFIESFDGDRVEFEDGLPPSCAEAMREYVDGSALDGNDLVELFAVQDEFGREMADTDSPILQSAQREELSHLVGRLIGAGIPVVIGGGDGKLEDQAFVAYGLAEDGIVYMDHTAVEETARRRSVFALTELEQSLKGVLFFRDGLQSRAIEAQLRAMLEHVPENHWPHYLLGRLLNQDDRHREAVDSLRKAVQLYADSSRYWSELGDALSEVGRFDEAVAAVDKAIELGLNDAYHHGQRGYALRKLGRYDEARAAFGQALELEPDRTWAARQLGWTHHEARDDPTAEEWFRRAIQLAPDNYWSRLSLAAFLACVGRRDEVRELMLTMARTESDGSRLTRIGTRLLMYGFPTDALAVFERAVAAAGEEDQSAHLGLARAYLALGDEDSLHALLRPIEERLSIRAAEGELDSDLWTELAYARAMLGRREAAREAIEAIVREIGEPNANVYYEIACVHALNDDADRALTALGLAIEAGYRGIHWARLDFDLSNLHDDRRFDELIGRCGADE